MNEKGAREALKTFLTADATTLVSGLAHQGVSRQIQQIATTVLAPPKSYYALWIEVTEAWPATRAQVNSVVGNEVAHYRCLVHVADYAIPQSDDDQIYEVMSGDFRLLTDRIAALLRDPPNGERVRWIPTTGSDPRFRLVPGRGDADRSIRKVNMDSTWEDAQGFHALLYCQIQFEVVECISDNATELYP